MEAILTILIPTYDRPDKVKALVNQLLPQRSGQWKLVIFDNHSPTPVRDLVPEDVEVVRHSANIGSGGNFPRCFEYAQTEWVWLIGDDDTIDPDGVQRALDAIAMYPDAAVINFGAPGFTDSRTTPVICHGMDEYLARCDSPTHMVWMSANIYARKHYLANLRYGYRFGNTMSCQYVLLLLALLDGKEVVLLPDVVTRPPAEAPPDAGNHGERVLSQVALLDLPFTARQRKAFAQMLHKSFAKLISDAIHTCYLVDSGIERSETLYLFSLRWSHMVIAERSFVVGAAALACRIMLGNKLGRFLLRSLAYAKGKLTGKKFVAEAARPRFFRA
ncbi:glycosyltransferase involved in cell wall biosynthesis [Rhizomicrobium palustre]|uniref:Glycosyltransferase involved in cell wall biosynthesis n=1 Tax=Rhizomicrobium palustre TaxID=189966 RepID=A0A846MUW7_9PROT|nr:glycosyltransferase [Rhizomicrobium palustre]NIK86902.1 glycosyltransferase involved in cell wall biosynthesis [Rhizomicrobium palustre]